MRIFHRDGFVVVRDALNAEQLAMLREASDQAMRDIVALDPDRSGNRGSHRYSFGGSSLTRSMLHLPAWQMLVDLPTVTPIVAAIFESPTTCCAPQAVTSAFPARPPTSRCTRTCVTGPMRGRHRSARSTTPAVTSRSAIFRAHTFVSTSSRSMRRASTGRPARSPGSQHSRAPFPTLAEEPEWMRLSTVCPAPAGSVQIRDVRAWHGGTPNVSDHWRAIPNLEFYAPWFREPMIPGITKADHRRLSEHAQRLTRYSVIDSSDELVTGYSVAPTATTPRRRSARSAEAFSSPSQGEDTDSNSVGSAKQKRRSGPVFEPALTRFQGSPPGRYSVDTASAPLCFRASNSDTASGVKT